MPVSEADIIEYALANPDAIGMITVREEVPKRSFVSRLLGQQAVTEDPRRRVTGISYAAGGSIAVGKAEGVELGSSRG